MSENPNQLLKLARELGKMTFKIKKELGFKEPPPPMKPYIRAPYRRNVVTPETADQAMIDTAKTHGISVENKSVEEIRRELILKINKSREANSKLTQKG